MPIVSGITKKIEIPHEPGQWVKIRQLSWRQKEKASDAKTDATLARVKAMGHEIFRGVQAQTAQLGDDIRETLADPTAAYDQAMILQFGLVEWSYDAKVTAQAIDDLDEVTADWLTREILAFSGPPSGDEQKNG